MAKRVAVINDDTAFLTLMRQLLDEEGYDASCYKEGAAAYEEVRAFDPDAIVLDIRLEQPETGWKVLDLFKLDRLLGTRPIIVCSADERALRERAAYLRAKGCSMLPKPFDLDDLLRLLDQLVGSRSGEDQA